MKSSSHLLAMFFGIFVISVSAAAQVPEPGPPEGVPAHVGRPGPPTSVGSPQAAFQTPLGFEISLQHHEDLKHAGPPPFPTAGTETHNDTNTAPANGDSGFDGPTPNGWIPYDAAVAVGLNHVLVMANSQFSIYNKAGARLSGPT